MSHFKLSGEADDASETLFDELLQELEYDVNQSADADFFKLIDSIDNNETIHARDVSSPKSDPYFAYSHPDLLNTTGPSSHIRYNRVNSPHIPVMPLPGYVTDTAQNTQTEFLEQIIQSEDTYSFQQKPNNPLMNFNQNGSSSSNSAPNSAPTSNLNPYNNSSLTDPKVYYAQSYNTGNSSAYSDPNNQLLPNSGLHASSTNSNSPTTTTSGSLKASVKRKNNDVSGADPIFANTSNAGAGDNAFKSLSNSVATASNLMVDESRKTNKEISLKGSTYNPMIQFPVILFQAFNGGDLTKVKEIIVDNTASFCSLKTPALDNELVGQKYVVDFFQAISDAHPDAVWVAKKCKFIESSNEISCRIYFAGTRIQRPQLLSHLNGVDINYHHSDYLYKKPNASLLDEMDVSMLSEQEIVAMKELEQKGRNLSIFGKGNMILSLTNDGTNRIIRIVLQWIITSFREADV